MAHLRGIEGPGLDSIWIRSDIYGPAVLRSVLPCTRYKRYFNAHEVTVATLAFLLKHFFKENPEIEEQFLKIVATVEIINPLPIPMTKR